MRERAEAKPLLYVEGNKGGSYVRVDATERDDVVRLEVGHDCVVRFARPINVWALAAVLAKVDEVGFAEFLGEDDLPEWGKPW